MADIATVFHWGPDALMAMDMEDLLSWHSQALDRAKLLFRVR